MPFRILIADDSPAIRKVLRALIESHPNWEVCGEAKNGYEAVVKAAELKPDLIILDMAMPIMDGVTAAREISNATPVLPLLMHTMHGSAALNLEAKKAGVRTIVSKAESGDKLIGAIEELLKAAQAGTIVDVETRVARTAAAAESTRPTQGSENSAGSQAASGEGKTEPEPH